VDKVHVSYCGDDQGLEGGGRKALYDARCEELFVGVRTLANCCADEGEEACDEEDRAFAVFAGDGAVEGATGQYRGITNARILRSIHIIGRD